MPRLALGRAAGSIVREEKEPPPKSWSFRQALLLSLAFLFSIPVPVQLAQLDLSFSANAFRCPPVTRGAAQASSLARRLGLLGQCHLNFASPDIG